MRINNYLKYLYLQLFVIISVLLIFRFIPDRQVAATIAGLLFVALPLILIIQEYQTQKFKNLFWYAGVLQFWLFFALPILGIRLLNWGMPFDQLSFMGIPGPVLHQYSSKSYILMMVLTVFGWWQEKKLSGDKK